MKSSRARLILMLPAPAVALCLGLTACAQNTSPSPRTPAFSTGIPSPAPGSTTSSAATPEATNPQAVSPAPGVNTATAVRRVPSTLCVSEQRWGTSPKNSGTAMSPSALYGTRVGRHACYDRVVFDINGSEPVAFAARYVPVVRADGSGRRVPVAGGAALEVIVRAPILGADGQGHQPWRTAPAVGESLVAPSSVSGWSSLRAVTFAGSFEGQTTMAVGVRNRLPFRILVNSERDLKHVVLDIAH